MTCFPFRLYDTAIWTLMFRKPVTSAIIDSYSGKSNIDVVISDISSVNQRLCTITLLILKDREFGLKLMAVFSILYTVFFARSRRIVSACKLYQLMHLMYNYLIRGCQIILTVVDLQL